MNIEVRRYKNRREEIDSKNNTGRIGRRKTHLESHECEKCNWVFQGKLLRVTSNDKQSRSNTTWSKACFSNFAFFHDTELHEGTAVELKHQVGKG